MPVTTVGDLLDSLRALHLLEEAQLAKVAELKVKLPDPQALAKELVKKGWLTLFQAKMLFQGKGSELLLGNYVLLDRIGEGGMGEVFKAKNWRTGRIVAFKIIRKERLKNENAVRRFYREVKLASTLSHVNIVQALDADKVNDVHFFAMEFVEGTDLTHLVRKHGTLPVVQACNYMRQSALALQHAYEKGLVHRDIKPSNLFVSTEGVVKLLDMGLARTADPDETSTLTQEGSVLGTLDYLSPEQALNAKTADIRSDLYSLGCTFYFLLTGQVPYPGGTATEKLLKHRLEEPEPIAKRRPDVPASVAAVVRKLMAKDPAQRYQTPAALAADLAGGPNQIPPIVSPGGKADASPTLAGAGHDTLRGPSSATAVLTHKRWLIVGIGAGALVSLLLACVFFMMFAGGGGEAAKSSGGTVTTKKTKPTSEPQYVKMDSRDATILATLKKNGYPTLEGKWHWIGYFDVGLGKGFDTKYPPESEIDLAKSYPVKGGTAGWKLFTSFPIGARVNLNDLAPGRPFTQLGGCVYLAHELETAEPLDLPVGVGGDDMVAIWVNGEKMLSHGAFGPFTPDKVSTTLRLKPGKNQLLVKVCNAVGDYYVELYPRWPAKLEAAFGSNLKRDFPGG